MKEIILRGCNEIPVTKLSQYIDHGTVTLEELIGAGLSAEKVAFLHTQQVNADHTAWNTAVDDNTPAAYYRYIEQYPKGLHTGEAYAQIAVLEDYYWNEAYSTMDVQKLRDYLGMYPNGLYSAECTEILADGEWFDTCRRDTIGAYRAFQERHPGKYTMFIEDRIFALQDTLDWETACSQGTTEAYRYYISVHPDGEYVATAQARIQANAGREQFINTLRYDLNAYSAIEIQRAVENGFATWDDISAIMGPERTSAISMFTAPAVLPTSIPSPMLQPDSTEVYFWGTPSSGKTCALGSVISCARRMGIYEGLACSGFEYMTRLSNVFEANGFCTFPDSTSIGNIQEMILNLRDTEGKRHKVTLIDLAGELFRSVYFRLNGQRLSYEAEGVLNTALSYLVDKRNNKMHFFVVEYGAHNRVWEGLRMTDYLEKMIQFLRQQKIMSTTTVGVYVLVTKCDLIPCAPQDRPRMAYEYLRSELGSFWNILQDACSEGGVKDLKVLAFSVGDVFAQNLCDFDGRDSTKVIDKLITKTRAKGGTFGAVFDAFRQ